MLSILSCLRILLPPLCRTPLQFFGSALTHLRVPVPYLQTLYYAVGHAHVGGAVPRSRPRSC